MKIERKVAEEDKAILLSLASDQECCSCFCSSGVRTLRAPRRDIPLACIPIGRCSLSCSLSLEELIPVYLPFLKLSNKREVDVIYIMTSYVTFRNERFSIFTQCMYPVGVFAVLYCPLETTLSLEDGKTVLSFAKACKTEACVDCLYFVVSKVKWLHMGEI